MPTTPKPPRWLEAARMQWTNRGDARPPFAIEPQPGQESVWDYPRPPAIVADDRLVEVRFDGHVIASTNRAIRLLETSHPPSFYLPPDSLLAEDVLVVVPGSSHCEWKGEAEYFSLFNQGTPVGWRYRKPYPEFAEYASYLSFYPYAVDCYVDGELARPQAGGFYGGWITDEVVGPFKGEPGTSGW